MTVQHIAIGFIGSGSVYGQAETYEKAVQIAAREALGFAKPFGGFHKDTKSIPLMVFDYRPWESITWSDLQVWGYRTSDRSDAPTLLEAERYVWISTKTGKPVKDMTRAEWLEAGAPHEAA